MTVTYDGTSAAIWINGKLNAVGPLAAKNPATGVTAYLGAIDSSTGLFAGKMTFILFYLRVLSANEIRQLYSGSTRSIPSAPSDGGERRGVAPAMRRVPSRFASVYGVSP